MIQQVDPAVVGADYVFRPALDWIRNSSSIMGKSSLLVALQSVQTIATSEPRTFAILPLPAKLEDSSRRFRVTSSHAPLASAFSVFYALVSLLSLWIGYLTLRATITQPLYVCLYFLSRFTHSTLYPFLRWLLDVVVYSASTNNDLANGCGLVLHYENTHFTAQAPTPRQPRHHRVRRLE